MKKYLMILPLLALVLTGLACGSSEEVAEDIGTLTLNLTDAPVDADDITGVYISVTKVEIGDKATGEVEWKTLADYTDAPKELNLLDFTGGLAYEIGQFEIAAGTYNQLRFYLDAPEEDQGPPESPGCYVEFADETTEPLYVPSGSNSGYKAVGAFEVAANGTTEITVDFDARKSLRKTGGQGQNQRYILKPTLRLVVDSDTGSITGTVNDQVWGGMEDHPWVAYAYEVADWDADEYNTPDADGMLFTNAVTSANLAPVAETTTGTFTLAYLEQDVTYIIVFAVYTDLGELNEMPIVLAGDDAVLLDRNTVNLGTLTTGDYDFLIPGVEE